MVCLGYLYLKEQTNDTNDLLPFYFSEVKS